MIGVEQVDYFDQVYHVDYFHHVHPRRLVGSMKSKHVPLVMPGNFNIGLLKRCLPQCVLTRTRKNPLPGSVLHAVFQ